MTTPMRIASAAFVGVLVVGGAIFAINRGVAGPGAPPTFGPTQLDGAWQSCPTEQDIVAAGGGAGEARENAGCVTLTLSDGVFRETGASASTTLPGTYVVDGTNITIHRSNDEVFDFTWRVAGETLTLTESPKTGAVSPAPWLAKSFNRMAGATPVDGDWRACPTEAEIVAAGGHLDEAAGNAGCTTLTLRDGVFRESGASASTSIPGSYAVDGADLTIRRSNGEVFDFSWSLEGEMLSLSVSSKPGAESPAPWLAVPFVRT